MIHEKSIEILETVGVNFENKEVLEFFRKSGVRIRGNRVFFSRDQVEAARKTLKSSFVLETPFARLRIGGGGRGIATASGAIAVLKEGKIQTPVAEDYINLKKMDESSSMVNLGCVPGIYAADLMDGETELLKTALCLRYSKMPFIASCETGRSAAMSIEFIKEFYQDTGAYYTLGVENVSSPLRYSREDVAAILAYIKRNQPVCITCCSTPGMTSPITVAGTIVQNNAEILAGMVMTQMLRPGVPVIYGNVTYSSDLRKAVPVSWGPEVGVFIQYAKAMADFYQVPCRVGGSLSGAKQLDWQDGAETAVSMMTTLDCKTDLMFQALGQLDCLTVFSFEKYLLDEELLEARLSADEKNYITEENIHMDMIRRVGPGGSYMLEEETRELYRTELFHPRLFNCERYHDWKRQGMTSVVSKAHEELKERLKSYEQPVYDARRENMLKQVLSGRNLDNIPGAS